MGVEELSWKWKRWGGSGGGEVGVEGMGWEWRE